jgi:hypothetical protein
MYSQKIAIHYTRLTTSSTVLNARNSPLLRLPGELRNTIYEYVLDEGGYTFIIPHRPARAFGERKNRLAPLSVCRRIHQETVLLPLSLNEFQFFYNVGFRDLFLAIGPSKRRAIREVRLEDQQLRNILVRITGLQQLGFGSLSELLPNIQRIRVTTQSWGKDVRGGKTLGDWLRGGLPRDVDMKIEHRAEDL